MATEETQGSKKPKRQARYDADVLNRMKILREDQSSPLLGFSHGYVISRSPLLALFLTSTYIGLLSLLAFFAIDRFESLPQISDLHFLGFSISRTAGRDALIVTGFTTIDYALLIRGVGSNKRWNIAFFSVAGAAIIIAALIH